MPLIQEVVAFLDAFAPADLAAEWDNVGLLMGDPQATVERLMTCLTVTTESAAEAVEQRADLIVTHHPLPFRPLRRITTEASEGRLLWKLARHGVAIYSPHTAFDSTLDGINARLAAGIGLIEARPLSVARDELGSGRYAELSAPCELLELADRVKKFLKIDALQLVGDPQRSVRRIGVACGSAGELLPLAAQCGCDGLVTGEMRFHDCLAAESLGIGLVLAGHYASERFAVEGLADLLGARFGALTIWPSRQERDPVRWV